MQNSINRVFIEQHVFCKTNEKYLARCYVSSTRSSVGARLTGFCCINLIKKKSPTVHISSHLFTLDVDVYDCHFSNWNVVRLKWMSWAIELGCCIVLFIQHKEEKNYNLNHHMYGKDILKARDMLIHITLLFNFFWQMCLLDWTLFVIDIHQNTIISLFKPLLFSSNFVTTFITLAHSLLYVNSQGHPDDVGDGGCNND